MKIPTAPFSWAKSSSSSSLSIDKSGGDITQRSRSGAWRQISASQRL